MSLTHKLVSEIRIIRHGLRLRLAKQLYIKRDIKRQLSKLKNYKHGIREVQKYSNVKLGNFCIFVHFDPQGDISESVVRAIDAMRRLGIEILLICNHSLSDEQSEYFESVCHTVIVRDNQGFDFGAYKDGFNYIIQESILPERLIFLNDSVFFSETGLSDFFQRLLGDEDVVGAFENWGEDYHIQSFAFSVSSHIVNCTLFRGFWAQYKPVNNRIYAIENGEKKVSEIALRCARSSSVIYSPSRLFEVLSTSGTKIQGQSTTLPIQWRHFLEIDEKDDLYSEVVASKVVEIINETSPIHAGAYFFPRYLNCPLYKKDIVFRQRFHFWEVSHWTKGIEDFKEREEFLNILRKKGDAASLSKVDRRKYDVGVR